jgi:hypothetical protein
MPRYTLVLRFTDTGVCDMFRRASETGINSDTAATPAADTSPTAAVAREPRTPRETRRHSR